MESMAAARPRKRPAVPDATASAEDFYRDLVWNLQNGLLAVTRDGRIAVMNEVAYRVFGLSPAPNDIGRHYSDILREVPDVARIVAGAFDMAHLPNRAELRLKRTGKVIGYTLSQVRDPEGHVTGATLFFKDLTRVEQLEERERLRDRLAALGEMAAAIAHEVKNPLAGIEVMAGLLKRQLAENEDAQSILKDIIKEAKMANAIVIEVLDFVRPIRLQVERVALPDVVRDAITTAESTVPRRSIRLSVNVSDSLPPIEGDKQQLRQLFCNLLANAFEALDGEGSVRISAAERVVDEEVGGEGETNQVRMIEVEVVDDGPGIPADLIDRIFSPFFTTKPQGTGLGLAIVRKIVDAHDGRIDVSVAAVAGTRFVVTLPVDGDHKLFG
jgi:two-component system nitrogen regulation sensor histidine kinase GlnL